MGILFLAVHRTYVMNDNILIVVLLERIESETLSPPVCLMVCCAIFLADCEAPPPPR
jgi:hypothetical protein